MSTASAGPPWAARPGAESAATAERLAAGICASARASTPRSLAGTSAAGEPCRAAQCNPGAPANLVDSADIASGGRAEPPAAGICASPRASAMQFWRDLCSW